MLLVLLVLLVLLAAVVAVMSEGVGQFLKEVVKAPLICERGGF